MYRLGGFRFMESRKKESFVKKFTVEINFSCHPPPSFSIVFLVSQLQENLGGGRFGMIMKFIYSEWNKRAISRNCITSSTLWTGLNKIIIESFFRSKILLNERRHEYNSGLNLTCWYLVLIALGVICIKITLPLPP